MCLCAGRQAASKKCSCLHLWVFLKAKYKLKNVLSNYLLGFESILQNSNEFKTSRIVRNDRKSYKYLVGWILKNPLALSGLVLTSYRPNAQNSQTDPTKYRKFLPKKTFWSPLENIFSNIFSCNVIPNLITFKNLFRFHNIFHLVQFT